MILGAAPESDLVRAAYDDGAAAVFGDDAALYGLDVPLPAADQERREALQFDAHCEAMPRALMGGMVEAQRLRDAAFARATLDALETYGAPVVLITGNGHARRDWGVPAFIARSHRMCRSSRWVRARRVPTRAAVSTRSWRRRRRSTARILAPHSADPHGLLRPDHRRA